MVQHVTRTKAVVPAELQGLRPAGAYTFDELYRFAQMCHTSGLYGDVQDAAQAMIKIIKGQELGLPPTTAMTAFDIIQKRVFIKPWAIAALINACGYGSYEVTVQTPQACTIAFYRKIAGKGWTALPPETYTIEEAQAQGLTTRSAHWKASPAHMLYQRAMGRGGAKHFPELLAGIEAPATLDAVPTAQHQQNVIDLYGDVQPVHERLAAARRGYGQDAPQTANFPRSASGETSDTDMPSERTTETGRRQKPPSATPARDGAAWDTLRAYQDDARLPAEMLETIAGALGTLAPATDAEAHAIAGAVLDWLSSTEAGAEA